MRFGAFSYFGGTARFGGSVDAEERWYNLLQNHLGAGAYTKDYDAVRSRFLMGLARGISAMESEARKTANESVQAKALAALEDWEKIAALVFAPSGLKTIQRRQAFQRALMRILVNMANVRKIATEAENMIDDPNYFTWAEGYENDYSTMIGPNGAAFFVILLPEFMQLPEYRELYRAVEEMVERWAPAHTIPAIATSNDQVSSPFYPEFYSDGFRGCACGKDVPGA